MRFNAPLYEGDGYFHPGRTTPDTGSQVLETPAEAELMVRRTIIAIGENGQVNREQIERYGRAKRDEAIGNLLVRAYRALSGWFERREAREREEFLAASQDLSDLEHRMRRLERAGLTGIPR